MKINTMSITLNLIILCSVVSSCLAKDHSVTWGMGIDYKTWASGKDIEAGDNLVFKYASGDHTVSQVSEEDYNSCTTSKVYSQDQSGRTVIPLNTAGTRYFICTVPGHCQSGMKLAVTAGGKTPPAGRGCRKPPPSPGPAGTSGTTGFSSSATMAALSTALLAAAALVSLL